MFGKRNMKKAEEEQVKAAVVDEKPDLVVDQPQSMGMPGFTSNEAPQTMPEKTETGIPGFGSIGAPAPAPEPVKEEKPVEQYQIVGAEMMPDGLYRYVIVTNKVLGEVGGVYDI